MGHGVTQWFGAETMNSATSLNQRMDMKKFSASTDVGGNRVRDRRRLQWQMSLAELQWLIQPLL